MIKKILKYYLMIWLFISLTLGGLIGGLNHTFPKEDVAIMSFGRGGFTMFFMRKGFFTEEKYKWQWQTKSVYDKNLADVKREQMEKRFNKNNAT
jgi:hypothetical protein